MLHLQISNEFVQGVGNLEPMSGFHSLAFIRDLDFFKGLLMFLKFSEKGVDVVAACFGAPLLQAATREVAIT